MSWDKVPWSKIHDFLLEVETCPSRTEFFRRVATLVQSLIPYDVSAAFFSAQTAEYLGGAGLPASAGKDYNEYYRLHMPFNPSRTQKLWYREFANTEFVSDFSFPNHLEYGVCKYDSAYHFAFTLHRSRRGPDFSDQEYAILEVLTPHLSNLLLKYDGLEAGRSSLITPREISDRAPQLSRRETEILSLLAAAFTAPEIATRLFISVRTVEGHVNNTYAKLDVHSKREAIRKVADVRYKSFMDERGHSLF